MSVTDESKLCIACEQRPAINGHRVMCEHCHTPYNSYLWRILSEQLRRAKKHGVPATLTLKQWIETLEDFKWMCAYCQEREYEVIEHFLPVLQGGGTTVDNCVPACQSCNHWRANAPWLVESERISAYLALRGAGGSLVPSRA